jgi:Zn ribbon nucleic-acid-binding protein
MSDKKTFDRDAYWKKYYEENKDSINELVTCDKCGLQYKKCKKSVHEKQQKHLKKSLEIENKKLKDECEDTFKNSIGEEVFFKKKKEEMVKSTKKIILEEFMKNTKKIFLEEFSKNMDNLI